jgi:GNAT superfamily N-acetyltransferase
MDIIECNSDQDIMSTYPVMSQLRPHVREEDYLSRIREMEGQGGKLIAVKENQDVLGCAFFRRETRLFTGPMIYVDDLVSDGNKRSKGVGHAMIEWIAEYCRIKGIKHLVLDSGVQREQAHKFYFREGFTITSFNFKKSIE